MKRPSARFHTVFTSPVTYVYVGPGPGPVQPGIESIVTHTLGTNVSDRPEEQINRQVDWEQQ